MNWTNTAEKKMLESLEYQRTTQLRMMAKNYSWNWQGNWTLQETDTQRVHRLGKKKRSKAAKPRGIIARFFSYAKKQEFIEKRKKLKGTKIAACENLTSTKYKLHTYLQNHPNIQDAYVWNGAMKVTYKNTWYNIKNTDDLFQLNIDINWKEMGVKFLADLHA